MTEPIQVMRLTTEAITTLQGLANTNPELWQDPTTAFAQVLRDINFPDHTEPTDLCATDPIHMPSAAHLGNMVKAQADKHALIFHRNIPGITPALMADPGILAWLSCFHLLEYGISRWPLHANSDTTKHVLDHYLPEKGRAITNSSVAGRTLWVAQTALRVADQNPGIDPQRVLNHFSKYPEHYHFCMGFAVIRAPLVLNEYVHSLLTDAQGVKSIGANQIARDINRAAGPVLIDALDRQNVQTIIADSVDRVMRDPDYVADRTKLRGRRNIQALSLGAGVQSTVMALMAEEGYDGFEKPDFAIFADTGWEPPGVYAHLAWLETQLSFPVIRVSAGNIRESLVTGKNLEGRQFIDIPVFVTDVEGKHFVGTRQCTKFYKLEPIHKHLKERLELRYGKQVPKDIQVDMWLGISVDEVARMKASKLSWITNVYPFIREKNADGSIRTERQMSRRQLQVWFQQRYPGRNLPKSSCIGCPYHSDKIWKEMKQNDPESFQDAVLVESAMQVTPGALDKGTPYLHRARVPLDQVDFSRAQTETETMQEECDGLCEI